MKRTKLEAAMRSRKQHRKTRSLRELKRCQRDEQLEKWDIMRNEAKRMQREDRRLNIFWRRNKTITVQFGGDEETLRMDETTYKYLGFEMKNGDVDRKEMMAKLEEWIREKLDEPSKRVEVFETLKIGSASSTRT